MNEDLKILIIEDTEADSDLLLRELKKFGFVFTFEITQSRESFKKSLVEFKPNLILSDFNLPTFDGLSAFYIKQEINPDIPFIIVSGTIGEERAVELIKIGITDCAQKDKLFTLGQKIVRALKEVTEKEEKSVAHKKIIEQNKKLYEIAFLQSHQIRRPISNILGLIKLFDKDHLSDPSNIELLINLEIAAKDLDNIIQEITQKTSEI